MSRRVYVSGPVTGYPDAFRRAADNLARAGHVPVVPLDVQPDTHDGDCPRSYSDGPKHSSACHLRADVRALLDCDEIHMLPGWEASVGARLELQVATAVGMTVSFAALRGDT